ncbi:TIGR02391 family protein [Kribbella sp. NBC_00709]|uniref:TIGR02391 family protein n=1 Tax=Kribbella sp. NBC_00709 TaxID=2975972 RepID=UPI002E2830D4|nr:TIGR02391 family protein [Kribbella sp. NBC_00709]
MNDSLSWKLEKLRDFIAKTDPIFVPSPPNSIGFHSYKAQIPEQEVIPLAAIIEKILEQEYPGWKIDVEVTEHERYRWRQMREAATKCLARLEAQEEIALHLGGGPTLNAGNLHPWVWEAAKPAWEAGNYEDAVDAAARNINSRLRPAPSIVVEHGVASDIVAPERRRTGGASRTWALRRAPRLPHETSPHPAVDCYAAVPPNADLVAKLALAPLPTIGR